MIPVRKIFNILESMNEEETAELTKNDTENGEEPRVDITGIINICNL